MALSSKQRVEVAEVIATKIRQKLSGYKRETSHMPFHIRLLGKDRMALFSFIHSLNTTFGQSIFEPVATVIARPNFKQIEQQFDTGEEISDQALLEIQAIIDGLRSGEHDLDKPQETARVLSVAGKGEAQQVDTLLVDLFLETFDGQEYCIDLKTVKPNKGEIIGHKRTLLEWVAIRGRHRPNLKLKTMLGIPYNPYEPKPYDRWTLKGMFDTPNEVLVADEFWNFLGGPNTYEEVLDVFEKVGIELRSEIDERFARFK